MRLLVTGATGMLGQELVPLLLKSGYEIYALSRKPRKSTHSNLHYIKGDVTKPGLDIEPLEVDAVLHMAALTSLRERNKDELFIQNYLGTQNIVRYCEEHGIKRLFYVSTAYVCGTTIKTLKEEPISFVSSFRNLYEDSKYRAEVFVNRPSLDWTIFRPGILVGRYSDGKSRFFEGFYRPVRALVATHYFAEQKLKLPRREVLESKLHLPILNLPVRIYGDPNSPLGLTPVDFAAKAISELLNNSSAGKVYNIVPDKLPVLSDVVESINEVLGITGFHVNAERTSNVLDMFYNRLIRDFYPYLHDHPVIETSVGNKCPPVDKAYLRRIIAYWRTHDAGLAEERDTDYDSVVAGA